MAVERTARGRGTSHAAAAVSRALRASGSRSHMRAKSGPAIRHDTPAAQDNRTYRKQSYRKLRGIVFAKKAEEQGRSGADPVCGWGMLQRDRATRACDVLCRADDPHAQVDHANGGGNADRLERCGHSSSSESFLRAIRDGKVPTTAWRILCGPHATEDTGRRAAEWWMKIRRFCDRKGIVLSDFLEAMKDVARDRRRNIAQRRRRRARCRKRA